MQKLSISIPGISNFSSLDCLQWLTISRRTAPFTSLSWMKTSGISLQMPTVQQARRDGPSDDVTEYVRDGVF